MRGRDVSPGPDGDIRNCFFRACAGITALSVRRFGPGFLCFDRFFQKPVLDTLPLLLPLMIKETRSPLQAFPCHGPHDARLIKGVASSTRTASTGSPAIKRNTILVATRPISNKGWWIVVKAGVTHSA